MSLINNLLQSAAVIRDASHEGENTALRVGNFLVSLIEAIVASLPNKVIDANVIGTQATETNFVISLQTKDSDGNISNKQITVPGVTAAAAGLMSPTDKANLTSAVNNAAQALIAIAAETEAREAKDTEQDNLISTLDTQKLNRAEVVEYLGPHSTLTLSQKFLTELLTTFGHSIGQNKTDIEALQEQVAQEVADRGEADTAEADARAEADTSLGERIDEVERDLQIHENTIATKLDSANIVTLSESDFDALAVKDPNKIYMVYDD